MSQLVAGHDFDSLDRCRTCPRTWFQIMHVTRDQIGEMGIAHYDGEQGLTHNEYASIETRRARERPLIWDLVVTAATGNGPASRSINDEIEAAEAA